MADFLSAYSVQQWLESAPQGYLMDTEHGHPPGEKEPELVLGDPLLREQAIRTTVQLVVGERCALSASGRTSWGASPALPARRPRLRRGASPL